jgi:hypothetical protein
LFPEKPSRRTSNAAAVKAGARKALERLLKPLAGFAIDCGLSVSEVNLLLREAAVRNAAQRQYQNGQRVNISGIAAMTGISRGEISRILRQAFLTVDQIKDRYLSPTNTVLKAWHSDPKFLTTKRQPSELKLFGRGRTFESLVNKYGRGIPVRAILDELIRLDVVEMRDSHSIYPIMPVAVDRRITPRMIDALCDGATDRFRVVSRASRLRATKILTKRSETRRNFRRVS